MAYLGYSNQFDLDDEGILRDSRDSPTDFLLDDHGIVQDDIGFYKPSLTGHWTDSGFGTDKRSSTSTLQHLDFHSHVSLDDDSHQYYLDESVNISDLEASRDELSLDHVSAKDGYGDNIHYGERTLTPKYLNDTNTSVDRLYNSQEEDSVQDDSARGPLNEEYYKQLRDLGVLIDDDEDLTQKNSLLEFENLENKVSRHNLLEDQDNNDAIGRFLQETPTNISVTETKEAVVPQHNEDDEFIRHRQYEALEKKFDNLADLTFESRRQSDAQSTISSRTFPEITPEEALQIYTRRSNNTPLPHENNDNDAASIDFENSQKNQDVIEEDELFLINGGFVSSSNIENYYQHYNQTSPHSLPSSRPFSQASQYSSRPVTPGSTVDSLTPLSYLSATDLTHNISKSDIDTPPHNSRLGAGTPHTIPSLSRPESVNSHISVTSEGPSRRHKVPKANLVTPSLPKKARSQPSLVESKKSPLKSDKMPKRLLPKPSVSDTGQAFKVRSKSTPNVSRSRPVKPPPSPLSESHLDDDDIRSVTSEKSSSEVNTKLKKEFERRKQATELVHQLQKDYDNLLSKYAQAELTIDQMRLGAKISLHAESPVPGQMTTGTVLNPAQSVQVMSMGGSTSSRATMLSSPHSAIAGRYSPMTDSVSADIQSLRRSPALSASRNNLKQPSKVDSAVGGENGIVDEKTSLTAQNEAASVKTELLSGVGDLNERIESFKVLVLENHLTTEEQEKVFEKIKTDHEKLRRSYLQAKDDYNAIKRSGSSGLKENFDENKQLEGELFKLGMTFDEVQEQVEEKVKERSQRLPFKEKRKPTDGNNLYNDKSIDHLKKKVYGADGTEYRQSRGELPLSDDRYERLQGEYNEIVARTNELQSMTPTAEGEREMNKLTKRLKRLNDEDPHIFRIPLEMQDRDSHTTNPSAWEKFRTKSPWERRWERLRERELEENGARYDNTSRAAGVNGMRSPSSSNNGLNSSFKRDAGSHGERSLHSSDLDSDHRKSGDMNSQAGKPVGLLPPRDRRTRQDARASRERLADRLGGSQNSLDNRDLDSSLDFNDGNNNGARLRRPNRHDFPDRRDRDRGMKKKVESGSLSSLQDSGISDQEAGLRSLNLPGPGKFKQMTSRKPTDDLDSGFIGSVVTSDVGQLPSRQSPSQQKTQQQQQSQQLKPLRLRHPAESSNDSSRLSDRSATKIRDATSRKPHSKSLSISTSDQGEQTFDYDETGTLTDLYTSETEEILSSQSDQVRRPGSRQAVTPNQSADKFNSHQQQQHQKQNDNGNIQISQEVSQGARPKKPITPKSPITKTARNILGLSHRREASDSDDESDLTPRAAALRLNSRSRERFSSEEELFRATSGNRTFGNTLNGDLQVKSSNLRSAPIDNTTNKSEDTIDAPVKGDIDDDNRSVDSDARSDHASIGSNNSDKLKALQDEVNALKEAVQQANSQQFYPYPEMLPQQTPYAEVPPALPPQAPPGHHHDEFYDPFDDPNALFGAREGFRRRANSFSGRGEREFDEWYWSLPQNRQGTGTEIPLGFAAADAYATHPENSENVAPRQSRRAAARHRRLHKARITGKEEQNTAGREGYDSDQSPSRLSHPQATAEQPARPNHFIPSKYSTDSMRQQMSNRGYFTTPSGAKIFTRNQSPVSNTGQFTGYYGHQLAGRTGAVQPGYRPSMSRFVSPPTSNVQYGNQVPGHVRPSMQRRYSLGDLQAYPTSFEGQNYNSAERHYTTMHSIPRSSNYANSVYPNEPLYGNSYHHSPERSQRTRQRSKSIATIPQYRPGQREAYFMNEEFESDSDGVASDGGHRRSDGARRRRRKYRKLRDDDLSEDRRGRIIDHSEGLDESLRLSRTIEKLTNKMLDKVEGELTASMKYGRYGSSIW